MASNLPNATSDLVSTRAARYAAPLSLPRRNSDAARRAVRAVRGGVHVLRLQLGLGRPVEDMPDPFREWIIDFGDSGYVVRYRVDADIVTVLAVRHQKEVGSL